MSYKGNTESLVDASSFFKLLMGMSDFAFSLACPEISVSISAIDCFTFRTSQPSGKFFERTLNKIYKPTIILLTCVCL